jgi:hypothetical protein
MKGGQNDIVKDDKLNIVNQHLKSVDHALYNLELDLIEAEAVPTPDSDAISGINSRTSALTAKRTALMAEKASVEAE